MGVPFSNLAVPFIENVGQYDPQVAFAAPLFGGTAFITRDGKIVYALPVLRRGRVKAQRPGRSWFLLDPNPVSVGLQERGAANATSSGAPLVLTEDLVGATPQPRGGEPSPTNVNLFLGSDPSRWRRGVRTWQSVSLGAVYPGITLELRAHGRSVEKVFTLAPGANTGAILLKVLGTDGLRTEDGSLVAGAGPGDIRFSSPVAYQESQGSRKSVAVAYGLEGRFAYGLRLGPHDPALPVVIDPILQSTYLGGTAADDASTLAINPANGDVYVAGSTQSWDFVGTAGGAQSFNWNSSSYCRQYGCRANDAFVVCLSADLRTLRQATYFGGTGDDSAFALAVDPSTQEVFIAGVTSSLDLPGRSYGFIENPYTGVAWGFVAKFDSSLTQLRQSTYLTGYSGANALAVAIDPTSGEVLVAGWTSQSFPYAPKYSPRCGPGGYVIRLRADLRSAADVMCLDDPVMSIRAISVDPRDRSILVAGTTRGGFLCSGRSIIPEGRNSDGFVARLNADLSQCLAGVAIGGGDNSELFGLAIDLNNHDPLIDGDVLVVGDTLYPTSEKVFVARLTPDLVTVKALRHLGGSGSEGGSAIAVHPATGEVFVAGQTTSKDFPGTLGGAQESSAGPGGSGFACTLTPDLTEILQSTYFPASPQTMVIAPSDGNVYLGGTTGGPGLPAVNGGACPVPLGDADAFVAKLTADLGASSHRVRRHLHSQGP